MDYCPEIDPRQKIPPNSKMSHSDLNTINDASDDEHLSSDAGDSLEPKMMTNLSTLDATEGGTKSSEKKFRKLFNILQQGKKTSSKSGSATVNKSTTSSNSASVESIVQFGSEEGEYA